LFFFFKGIPKVVSGSCPTVTVELTLTVVENTVQVCLNM